MTLVYLGARTKFPHLLPILAQDEISDKSRNSTPLTRKKTNEETGEDELYITAFVWKPRWFVLAQTDGEPVPMPEIPEWNKERALAALGIEQIPFTHTNGNVQGYAKKAQVAVSPIAELPHETLFHEVAHVVLLHTMESDISDSEQTPRSLREVEAEAVALLVCESLGVFLEPSR